MKNQEMHFSCHSCNKEMNSPPGEPLCEMLQDWLTISCWNGPRSVKHYTFCSFSCLKSWVDTHVPTIPDVFLESFKENET